MSRPDKLRARHDSSVDVWYLTNHRHVILIELRVYRDVTRGKKSPRIAIEFRDPLQASTPHQARRYADRLRDMIYEIAEMVEKEV